MAIRQDASTGQMIDDGKPETGTPPARSGGKPTMQVQVYSPFKTYFNGSAYSVSCENATGPFDILPKHHNFISLLTPSEMVIRTEAGSPKIRIGGGILHVKADHVVIFLDV